MYIRMYVCLCTINTNFAVTKLLVFHTKFIVAKEKEKDFINNQKSICLNKRIYVYVRIYIHIFIYVYK